MRSHAVLALAAAVFALTGCAGAHYRVSVDRLRYPASLSFALPNEQGKPLHMGRDLDPVGEFAFTRTSVGYLYGLTGTAIDLSDDLNREVETRRGEGIVRLAFRPKTCASSWFFPLTILPFYPGCQNLTVTGTVVSRKASAAEPGSAAK